MMIRVYPKKKNDINFYLAYTFSKLIYEGSFVLGFFPTTFMKKT